MTMREERELEDHTSRAPAESILYNENGEGGFDDVDPTGHFAPESE
jgi:hypothetical protein